MHRQLRSLSESGTAVGATVRLVFLVCAHVLRQVPLKLLIAHFAMEGLDVPMETVQMFLQRVPPKKPFPANITYVISNLLVPFQMQLQVGGTCERRIALVAVVRTRSGVRPQVLDQLPSPGEPLCTVIALVRFVSGVDAQMQPQPLFYRETLLAVVAHVYLRALQAQRVLRLDVVLEGTALPEALVALEANERPLVSVYALVLAQVIIP